MRFGGGGCGDNIDTIGHVKSVRKLKRDAYILFLYKQMASVCFF